MKIRFEKESGSNKRKTIIRKDNDINTDIKSYNEKMNCSYSGLPSIYAYE